MTDQPIDTPNEYEDVPQELPESETPEPDSADEPAPRLGANDGAAEVQPQHQGLGQA